MLVDSKSQATRLVETAKLRGYYRTVDLAKACRMNENTLRSAWNGTRPLTPMTASKLAGFLKVTKGWLLFGDPPFDAGTTQGGWADGQETVVVRGTYDRGLEAIAVTGAVMAGRFTKAYLFPKQRWITMNLPPDDRFPGITRHALVNEGHAMDRVCRHGGTWVFVMFTDLPGQGPGVGQYVIVERERRNGTIECSARKFFIGPRSTAMLACDTDEPGFDPISLVPSGDIIRVTIIGRVTDIVTRV